MSEWTWPLCSDCYSKLEPGRTPVRLRNSQVEICSECGDQTAEGIFYRRNISEVKFQGEGNGI